MIIPIRKGNTILIYSEVTNTGTYLDKYHRMNHYRSFDLICIYFQLLAPFYHETRKNFRSNS